MKRRRRGSIDVGAADAFPPRGVVLVDGHPVSYHGRTTSTLHGTRRRSRTWLLTRRLRDRLLQLRALLHRVTPA